MNLLLALKRYNSIWITLIAVCFAVLCGALLVVAMGVPLENALAAFSEGAWGSPYAVAASINRALVLSLIGLGFVFANRANLTNVGGEGQIAMGGVAATAMALYGGASHLPSPFSFFLPMAVAILAGGTWGAIAGLLKAKVGTNEVISTLLLSFVAVWLLYWSVQSIALLRQPMTTTATLPESREIPDITKIPLLGDDPSMPLHIGLFVALALALAVYVVLDKTAFGVHLRALGLNAVAARRAGIPIQASIVLALFIAGAMGGLAGAFMLQGEQYSLKGRFSSGYGFDGLVVGLLARGSVSGVIASALLFGFLRSGGINMEMAAAVPSAIVLIVQGLIILTLAGAAYWMQAKENKP
jgi:general nucleoside transport system permease protein